MIHKKVSRYLLSIVIILGILGFFNAHAQAVTDPIKIYPDAQIGAEKNNGVYSDSFSSWFSVDGDDIPVQPTGQLNAGDESGMGYENLKTAVKFNITDISGQFLSSAKLKIKILKVWGTPTIDIYASTTADNDLTYDSVDFPTSGFVKLASQSILASDEGQWVEFDLKDAIETHGDNYFSIILTAPTEGTGEAVNSAILSYSNSGILEDRPYLEVASVPSPKMEVYGSVLIPNGDTTPTLGKRTDLGEATPLTPGLKWFTIDNTGTADLNLTGNPRVSISGANGFASTEFTVYSGNPSQVAISPVTPGGQTGFAIQFSPSLAGLRTATVSIANDDPNNNPYTFKVQGTGKAIPAINVKGNGNSISNGDATPSTNDDTDFGSSDISGGTVVKTFTIENRGLAALNLNGTPKVVIGGTNGSDFVVNVDPVTPIAVAGTTTFQITFNPSGTGLRTATISIANDDPTRNPYTLSIQGTGTAAPVMNAEGGSNASGATLITNQNTRMVLYYYGAKRDDGQIVGPDETGAHRGSTAYTMFKFIPAVSDTYTISFQSDNAIDGDTRAWLYGSADIQDNNYLAENDDENATEYDFKVQYSLEAGKTYYLKMDGCFGDWTGTLKIDKTLLSQPPNTAPTFVGATTILTVTQDASATDIKGLLHVSDADASQTLTWTQSAAPSHGTLNISNATAISGSTDIAPGGTITYTPAAGYSGSDSFTVQASDGTASATRTISVSVTGSSQTTTLTAIEDVWKDVTFIPSTDIYPIGQEILGGDLSNVVGNYSYGGEQYNYVAIKFDISEIAGSITDATIKLHVNDVLYGNPNLKVYGSSVASGSWGETIPDINGSYPASDGDEVASIESVMASKDGNGYMQIQDPRIIDYLNEYGSDRIVTIVLKSTSDVGDLGITNYGNAFALSSDDDVNADYRPKLIVNYSAALTCTVNFDAEGGTVNPDTQNKLQGSTYGKASDGAASEPMPIPTRSGYIFAGWYDGDNGTGSAVTGSTTVPTAPTKTLYAKWEAEIPGWNQISNNISDGQIYALDVYEAADDVYAAYVTKTDTQYYLHVKHLVNGQWNLAGTEAVPITKNSNNNFEIVLNVDNNIPYIAYPYQSGGSVKGIRVDRYTGGSWEQYGANIDVAGLNGVINCQLVFVNGTAYAAYVEPYTSGAAETSEIVIRKYNNGWVSAGSVTGLTGGVTENCFDEFSLANNGGTLYAAYHGTYQIGGNVSPLAYLKKLEGDTWTKVCDLQNVFPLQSKLITQDGTLYNLDNSEYPVVLKYNPVQNNWSAIGGKTIRSGETYSLDYQIDIKAGNEMYIAYSGFDESDKSDSEWGSKSSGNVSKYNGTNWTVFDESFVSQVELYDFFVLNGSVYVLFTDETNEASGLKYYKYVPASSGYSLAYNANNASSGSIPIDGTNYANNATVTVANNTGNLARTGYTFAGWNTKSDGTGTDYAAGIGTFSITENTTLYAKWSKTTYTISGNAGVGDVTLSYIDGSAKTATADGTGAYSFTVSYNWTGTVTPSKTGYTFNASKEYSNVTSNQTEQNYTATAITYTITGNAGVSGATLSYTDGSAKTTTADGTGVYRFTVSYNWSGIVTPSKTGYTFSASKEYSHVISNQSEQNYTATAITYTITGNAGVGGATLSYTDVTAKTATADGTGAYSITVPYKWSGTITPTKTGYVFSASKQYNNVATNQTEQNYTATALTYTICEISNQTMTTLVVGYASGTQETKTIAVTRTGTGDLTNLAAALSGTNANDFSIIAPGATTLTAGTPSTTFTVKGKDGLAAGTYSATVTVSADSMTNVTFTITQVVKDVQAAIIYDNVTKTYGDTGFNHTATGGTGTGAFSYTSSDTAVATIDPATGSVTIIKAGTTTLTAARAGDADYDDASQTCTLTINKKGLTATVEDNSKTYGQDNPTFPVTVTGFVNGESAATAAGYTAPSAETTATATTGAGPAAIAISGGAATNYTFDTTDTGTLTINKKDLTATVEDNSKTYGQDNPAFPVTVTGFVNGETPATAAGYTAPTAGSNATATTGVGTAAITISGGEATNYTFNITDNGTLTINKKGLTATVEDSSKAYGQDNPAFPVTVTGFVNGETAATAADYTAPTASSNATTTTGAGTATITISGGAAANYAFNIVDTATLTINKAALIATVEDTSKTYGEENPAFPVTVSGFVNSETAATATGYTAPTASSTATATTGVGPAAITISGGAAANYSFNIADTGILTINKKALTATATANTKTYNGTATATGIISLAGIVGTDDVTASGTFTFTDANAVSGKTVNVTEITLGGAKAVNYTVNASTTATANIGKATLTATVADNSKTYGDENPVFPVTVTGFVNDENATTAAGYIAPAASSNATAITGPGPVAITISGGAATNYTFNIADTGTLIINKAILTATVEDNSKTYGQDNPAFPVTVTGFVNGETAATAAGYTAPTAGTTATATTGVGPANITISGGAATNYTFNIADTGTLTINKAVLTATVEDNSKTYGQDNPVFPVTVTGFANGETAANAAGYTAPTASSTATAMTGVGTAVIAISGGSASNYTFNIADTGTLTINKKSLTATVEDNSKTYGEANPDFPVAVIGFVNHETAANATGYTAPTASSTATDTTWVGTADITISGGAAANYTIDTADTGTLTINQKALMATATGSAKTYDGTTDATGTISLAGIVGNDDVTATGNFTFVDANVGENKTVNVTDITLAGTSVGNYTVNTETTTTANINRRSSGSSQPPQTAGTGVQILVNDKVETAATAKTTTVENKTVTTVVLNDKQIEEKLNSEGNNSTFTIPINNNSDVVVGELTGQIVKNMETKEATLEIKTETVTYTLPASQINIDNVSTQIGEQVELKDIKVNVSIAATPQNTVKIVEDTANKNSYQVVVKPVDFEIMCSSGGKTVDVSRFNGYVERTVAIPDGIDPSKITTGIVLNNDGTFSHVPTTIIVIDGKYYAKINSLTNSTYSVIYSPKTFKDLATHWAKDDVNDMASRLVIDGVGNGNFEPDRDITRAEFATIVVRALGVMKPGSGEDAFNDVTQDAWYYDAVSIASEYGIISGYGNGQFGPTDEITREQAMTMAARAMKITGLKADLQAGEADNLLKGYTDAGQAAEWAREGIAACVKAGTVSGKGDNSIAPKDEITRAEVAVIVRRLLQKSSLI